MMEILNILWSIFEVLKEESWWEKSGYFQQQTFTVLLEYVHSSFQLMVDCNVCVIDFLLHKCDFGTSSRRFSWLAFGWSTGKDIRGHYKRHYFQFSFFSLFLLFSSSSLSAFLIEGVLGSKTYLGKIDGNIQKPKSRPLS